MKRRDRARPSTVTETRHVIVESMPRDAAARAATEAQDWNHNTMINGYYMHDEVVA
jgi:hypothetical protein